MEVMAPVAMGLVLIVVVVAIMVAIARWVFRVNEIVDRLTEIAASTKELRHMAAEWPREPSRGA